MSKVFPFAESPPACPAGTACCGRRARESWCSGCCCGGCCRSARSRRAGRSCSARAAPRGVYEEYGRRLRNELAKDMPRSDGAAARRSAGSQENVRAGGDREGRLHHRRGRRGGDVRAGGTPPSDRLRGVARLYDDYVQLVVAPGSDIHSVADLRGKRVATGPPNSGVRLIAERRAEGGRDRPGARTSSRCPTASTPVRTCWRRRDRRVLLVGRAAHGRSARSWRSKSAFRFVPIEGELVAGCTPQGERGALLPGHQHAGVGATRSSRTAPRCRRSPCPTC